MWDIAGSERTLSLVGHTDVVWCVAHSSCFANIVASCSRDRQVIIWDTEQASKHFVDLSQSEK